MRLVTLCVLALLGVALGQLHGSLRPSRRDEAHPADRISFIEERVVPDAAFIESSMATGGEDEASEDATGLGDVQANGDPNDVAAQELKSSMEEVEHSIDYVKRMIAEQMEGISKHRAVAVDGQVYDDEADEQKAKREAEQARKAEEREKKEQAIHAHEAKRREEIANCLAMIRGGADKLYSNLQGLFARTPVDSVCTVFKAYEFPNLSRHGFGEGFYKGEQPSMSGDEALFFKAAKTHLFECMCEYSTTSIPAESVTEAVAEAEQQVQA